MFSYRAIIKQALSVAWKHKYLWFFGLFAAILAGGGAWEYRLITNNFGNNIVDGSFSHLNNITAMGDLCSAFGAGLANIFQQGFLSVLNALTIIIITLALLAVGIWLAATSQAALVNDVKKINNAKKKALDLSIRGGLTVGKDHFWAVLGLNILLKILLNIALFIVSFPLLFTLVSDSSFLFILYIVFFVIFIPLGTGLSLAIKYSIAARVLENKSFIASLEAGEKLFRKNWLVSLEMAVILFIINFLASAVIFLVIFIFLLPLIVLGALLSASWIIVVAILIAIAFVILAGSFLSTFQVATWTTLYTTLNEKGALAKLERLFSRR